MKVLRHKAADDPVTTSLPQHVECLSEAAQPNFEDAWYDITSSPHHFWMEWRLSAFTAQLRELGVPLDAPLPVLDVGGGHGVLRQRLEENTAWKIDLVDTNSSVLMHSTPGRGRTLFYDVMTKHSEMLGRYDAALLFDVLEHIEEPKPFLEAVLAHLRPGGWLFFNVPALQTFFSGYDEVVGHFRRYNRTTFLDEVSELNTSVVDMRYWGFAMLPLLAGRYLMNRRFPEDKEGRIQCLRDGCTPPSIFFDRVLRVMMRMETALARKPILGTSLMCALRAYDPEDAAGNP